ncbi:MAG: tetratricopeptide repeat protein [Pirellulaceae bacterium]
MAGIRAPVQDDSRTGKPARSRTALYLRICCHIPSWCWLLPCVLGCTSLSRRWQSDDVVSARQIAQRGMDAVDAGNWQRAEEFFAKAVDVCPVDERVQSRYAEALWHRGSRQAAVEHMQEAVRLSGHDPDLVVRLGEMHLQIGNLELASHLAERVIQSGRQQANAYRLRGAVREHQNQWQEALADYHRALSIQPQYPEVQMAIAQVYYRQGKPQRSLSTLQALAGAYPSGEEPAELFYWQGLACEALGRHAQAVSHLVQAEGRGMQSADLFYNLAQAHYMAGDPAAAELTAQRALGIDPTHSQAQRLTESLRQARLVASLPP